jgi:signal transduction histidine kinase
MKFQVNCLDYSPLEYRGQNGQSMFKEQKLLVIWVLIILFATAVCSMLVAGLTPFNRFELKTVVLLGCAIEAILLSLLFLCIKKTELSAANAQSILISSLLSPEAQIADLIDDSTAELSEKVCRQLEKCRKSEAMIFDFAGEIVCSLDTDFRICEINVNAESLLEVSYPQLLSKSLLELCLDAERERFQQCLCQAHTNGSSVNCQTRFKRTPSSPIDLQWTIEWSATAQRYYCVARDITQGKQLERLRAEITAMVSHDLRAPVAALSCFLESLLSGLHGELAAGGRKAALLCKNNVDHMLRLINQLLDAEKLESGNVTVDLHDVPLEAIIDSAASLLRPLADERGIDIEISGNDSAFLVLADFDRSVQVVLNLLSNAIKWSPDHSIVRVGQQLDGEFIRLEIVDQGPGVSAQQQETLFGRFQSSQNGVHSLQPGSGLGLYLARKLAELQAGELGMASELGKGSCFWYRLKQFKTPFQEPLGKGAL